MSILKNILSPFVQFKDEQKTEPVKEHKSPPEEEMQPPLSEGVKTVSPASTPPVSSVSTATSSAAPKGSMAEYQKHFDDLIDEANAKNPLFEGTDLKEFIESKVDVEGIADEEMRYKTAFNVLRRTGLTKERLVTTGQQYINVIENDLKGFENAYTQQYKTDVEQMEKVLQQKVLELKTLNDRIAVLNQEIRNISEKVTQSKDRLNSNKNAFILAGENKKKELQAELEKINQYFS